ncbi:MAG: MazG nucleotide pyrophosphohydrolase domain-containing protein [Cetobacterium sp.]
MSPITVTVEILKERLRQEKLKLEGKFPYTCRDRALSHSACLTILVEEVGEVARAIQEGDRISLREELIQVAAVCAAWVEGLDKKVMKPR